MHLASSVIFYSHRPEPQPEPISPLDLNDAINQLDLNHTSTVPTCPFCNLSWVAMKNRRKAAHMLSHSSTLHPALSTQRISRIYAVGTDVKRRHLYLHTRTLASYSSLCDKEHNSKTKKVLRLNLSASLVERWENGGESVYEGG